MTDYKILSDDRTVQMTEYDNDLKVSANFSGSRVKAEGEEIAANFMLIIDGNKKTVYTP